LAARRRYRVVAARPPAADGLGAGVDQAALAHAREQRIEAALTRDQAATLEFGCEPQAVPPVPAEQAEHAELHHPLAEVGGDALSTLGHAATLTLHHTYCNTRFGSPPLQVAPGHPFRRCFRDQLRPGRRQQDLFGTKCDLGRDGCRWASVSAHGGSARGG